MHLEEKLQQLELGQVLEVENFQITRLIIGVIEGWSIHEQGKMTRICKKSTEVIDYIVIIDRGNY
jgi:hypothetical protein